MCMSEGMSRTVCTYISSAVVCVYTAVCSVAHVCVCAHQWKSMCKYICAVEAVCGYVCSESAAMGSGSVCLCACMRLYEAVCGCV